MRNLHTYHMRNSTERVEGRTKCMQRANLYLYSHFIQDLSSRRIFPFIHPCMHNMVTAFMHIQSVALCSQSQYCGIEFFDYRILSHALRVLRRSEPERRKKSLWYANCAWVSDCGSIFFKWLSYSCMGWL